MLKFLRDILRPWLQWPTDTIRVPVEIKSKPVHPEPTSITAYYKYPTPFEALAEIQENKCFHCLREMILTVSYKSKRTRNSKYNDLHCTRDHIVSVAEQRTRGWHIPAYENMVLACGACNKARSATPMSQKDRDLARDINALALHWYRTEIVYRIEQVQPRLFGTAMNPNDREWREFGRRPRKKWAYLFQASVRAADQRVSMKKLIASGRVASDQLGQSGTVGERRHHVAVQLPPTQVGRTHPQPVGDFVFSIHARNEKVHGRTLELGVP